MSTLITPEFRGSFVALAEPRKPAPDAKAVYSIVVAIPKSEKEFLAKLDEEITAAATAKWGKVPPRLKTTLRDGDEEGREEFEGCMIFNCKSDSRPGVVDADLQPVLDPELLYSGAYYRVSVNPFAWEHPASGKGVSIGLNNVMWIRDGEAFSGRKAAKDDFSGV